MSVVLMTAAWLLDIPSTDKLVLLALADWANDKGRCWPSMSKLAIKTGLTDRSIRTCVARLAEAEHLSREERAGKGVIYYVHPKKIQLKQSLTPEGGSPRKEVPPGRRFPPEGGSPRKEVPLTPERRSANTLRTTNNINNTREHVLPEDWRPTQFGPKTKSREIVDGWTPEYLEEAVEHFTAHHRKSGQKFKSWQDAWSTWVLNSKKFGGNGHGNRQSGAGGARSGGNFSRALQKIIDSGENGPQAGDEAGGVLPKDLGY